jgi:hypothetical protein
VVASFGRRKTCPYPKGRKILPLQVIEKIPINLPVSEGEPYLKGSPFLFERFDRFCYETCQVW